MKVRRIFAGILGQKTVHFPHKNKPAAVKVRQILIRFVHISMSFATAPSLPPLHRARSAAATVLVVVVHPLVCGFSGRVITQFERIQQHDDGRCCCHQQKAGTWR